MKLSYLLAIPMAISSCSSETEPMMDYSNTPISIEVGVCDLVTLSRASSDIQQPFGLYLSTDGVTETDSKYCATNMQVSCSDNGGWTLGSSLYWKNNTSNVSYYAYSPYRELSTTSFNIAVSETTNSAEDLLYAALKSATATSNSGKISLDFKHMLSKLIVVLKHGSELDQNVLFSSVQLKDCLTAATFDVATGTVGTASGKNNAVTLSGEGDAYSAIIVPQNISNFTIEITDSNNKKYVYNASDLKFESGTQYTLNLTVGSDAVAAGLASVTAGAWTSSGSNTKFEIE